MKHWTTGTSSASGVDIHYLRTGGDKPAVVMLHGLTGSGACWTPLARALESDYDLVMPDARGHGSSGTPLTGYTYEHHARDVIALIEELGLDAPFILGHSMGGMTAAVVTARRSSDIRAVILVDPTFISPEWQREVYQSDVAEQHRRFLSQGEGEVLASLRARHPHRDPELLALVARARYTTRLEAFDVLTPPMPNYRELVSAIHAPVLLILGDRGVVSMETARELQELNPRVQVELVPDAGHGVHYDQPEHVAEVVRSLLVAVAHTVHYREATSADVPAMGRCRASDRDAGPADARMAAYLEGHHHPQQALAPRTAFVALDGDAVIGYVAGHATTRFGYDGEVQYLYVVPAWRRRGVARTLLRLLATWFASRQIHRVCVNADIDSPGAVPFYVAVGGMPLNAHWYAWEDLALLLRKTMH